jgi:hypothetical protein
MRRKSLSNEANALKKSETVQEEDGFVARRSAHVLGPAISDGDSWQETLTGKLMIFAMPSLLIIIVDLSSIIS